MALSTASPSLPHNIALLLSTMALSTTTPSLPPTTAPRPTFLGLPREVRDMILELCLCVSGYITPYAEENFIRHDGGATRTPAVAVLVVNKQVRNEALPILYGKNKWRMTGHDLRWKPSESLIWELHRTHFRHVIIYCDQLDVSRSELLRMSQQARSPKSKPSLRRLIVHDQIILALRRNIEWKVRTAMRMLHLTHFIIDVEGFYCPHGCCRLEMLEGLTSMVWDEWSSMVMRLEPEMPKWRVIFVGIEERTEEFEVRQLGYSVPPIPWDLG